LWGLELPRTLITVVKTVPELFLGEGAQEAAWLRARELLDGEAEGHPDVFVVSLEGATIRIDRVREAILWARYAPSKARYKVILIGPAERLSREAASALLKSLEEAPQYLAFILYALAPDQLLDTVRSRCVAVWAPSHRGLWQAKLKDMGYSDAEVDFLLAISRGEHDLVPFLKERRSPLSEWKEAQAEAETLPPKELAARFLIYLEDPIRRRAIGEALISSLPNTPADELLEVAERLSRGGREGALLFLEQLLNFLVKKAPLLWPRTPAERIASWARKASLARGELEANASVRLLLEVILLWPRKD